MKMPAIGKVLFPHKHKLRIVDCRMTRNGKKLYGVICRKCLTIVEAGVTYEEAEESIRAIKNGKTTVITHPASEDGRLRKAVR